MYGCVFFFVTWVFWYVKPEISSFCSFTFTAFHELAYVHMGVSGSCGNDGPAVSMGRIYFLSSGLGIWSSACLVWFLMVYGNFVRLAILMLIRLLWVVANAGATMMVAVSSNYGYGGIAPVMSMVLVVLTTAFTVVVC